MVKPPASDPWLVHRPKVSAFTAWLVVIMGLCGVILGNPATKLEGGIVFLMGLALFSWRRSDSSGEPGVPDPGPGGADGHIDGGGDGE